MTTTNPPELTRSITTDDLLRLIGSQTVIIARQGATLASQAARIAELDDAASSRVTTTSFDSSAA
jgi:hypothetical protein